MINLKHVVYAGLLAGFVAVGSYPPSTTAGAEEGSAALASNTIYNPTAGAEEGSAAMASNEATKGAEEGSAALASNSATKGAEEGSAALG